MLCCPFQTRLNSFISTLWHFHWLNDEKKHWYSPDISWFYSTWEDLNLWLIGSFQMAVQPDRKQISKCCPLFKKDNFNNLFLNKQTWIPTILHSVLCRQHGRPRGESIHYGTRQKEIISQIVSLTASQTKIKRFWGYRTKHKSSNPNIYTLTYGSDH